MQWWPGEVFITELGADFAGAAGVLSCIVTYQVLIPAPCDKQIGNNSVEHAWVQVTLNSVLAVVLPLDTSDKVSNQCAETKLHQIYVEMQACSLSSDLFLVVAKNIIFWC